MRARWIPASKPPKRIDHMRSQDVQVLLKSGRQRVAHVLGFSSKGVWLTSEGGVDVTSEVLYWQPLPPGPGAHGASPRLKVLPLDYWMDHLDDEERASMYGRYMPTEPRMHRPGMYKQGKVAWFETSDGKAYRYDVAEFDYKLRLYNAERLSIRQARALSEVVLHGLATREQQAILLDYRDMREIRQTGRNARKYVLRLGRERAANKERDFDAASSH